MRQCSTSYQKVWFFFGNIWNTYVFDGSARLTTWPPLDPTRPWPEKRRGSQWWGRFGITTFTCEIIGKLPRFFREYSKLTPREKTNMTGWKIHHEWRCWRCIFPIINWGFSNVMVVFRGDTPWKSHPTPSHCGRNNTSHARCESDFWVVNRKDCTGFFRSCQAW